MTQPTLHSFDELQLTVYRALFAATFGIPVRLDFAVDVFLKDDPHTIMLLTWLEMQR